MKDQALSTPGSDFLSSAFMIPNVGGPFLVGLAVGYFAKKMLKMALFVGGAAIVAMFIFEYYGIASISDTDLENAAKSAADVAEQSGDYLVSRLSQITSRGVSAAVGFFSGLKIG